MHTSFVRPILTLLVIVSASCYRYIPAVQAPPTAGSDVRAYLTVEGTQSLASILGGDVAALDGRILSDDGGVVRFSVSQTRTRSERRANWTGEPVAVPRAAIAKMELRILDRPRTFRAAAAYTAGGLALGLLVKGLAGLSGGSGGKGGPPPQ